MGAVKLCAEHGVMKRGQETCAKCGAALLDPDNPEHATAIGSAIAAHAPSENRIELLMGVPFAFILLGTFVYIKSERYGTYLAYVLVLATIGIFALASRHKKAWRLPVPARDRLRTWTSAMMLSTIASLVFVVLREALGIQALWYAAGLEPWRIATATFTHGGFLHLAGNMLFFWLFGPAVEMRVGRAGMAAIIVGSALAAALVQTLYSDQPMVGFSGAVYGVLGATLALMPASPQGLRIQMAVVVVPTWVWMLIVVPAYTLVAAFDRTSNTAWVAHLAGFVGGVVVALPLRLVKPSPRFLLLEQHRHERVAAMKRNAAYTIDIDAGSDAAPAAADVVTKDDAEIAAFHVTARRRRKRISAIGGAAMLLIGGAAAALATFMHAPALGAGRRTQTILVGLTMVVAGVAMLRNAKKDR